MPSSSASPRARCVKANRGAPYTVLRPTLEDFVVEMPRGAQVIYPKDLGPILMLADIGPGVRVLESGVGSGALSMTMLRAGADDRRLRAARGLRQPGPGQRALVPRRRRARPLPGRAAGLLRRHRRAARSTGSCSTCPSRGGSCPTPTARCAPAGSCRLHAVDHAGQPACARRWPAPAPGWRPARSRCCTARGTSRARPCAPTTAWWPTPGFLTVSPVRGRAEPREARAGGRAARAHRDVLVAGPTPAVLRPR